MLRGCVFGLVRAAVVAVAAGLAMAGCTSGALDLAAFGPPGGIKGPGTVAFESIDGPPETVFRRFVDRLGQEAGAHRLAMVSREQPAQYRIRGYVAAHVQGTRTTISWVWDVFTEGGRERVARFSGEVPGAVSERAWAAADDTAVARMAQDGMSRLSTFLAGASAPGDAASVSGTDGPVAYLPVSR